MASRICDSVLVTGSNRGIGLELVHQLVNSPSSPLQIFAGCRDPNGPRAQVRSRDNSIVSSLGKLVIIIVNSCLFIIYKLLILVTLVNLLNSYNFNYIQQLKMLKNSFRLISKCTVHDDAKC